MTQFQTTFIYKSNTWISYQADYYPYERTTKRRNSDTQVSYMIYNRTTTKCLTGGLCVSFFLFSFVLGLLFFKGLRALYSRLAYNDSMNLYKLHIIDFFFNQIICLQ